MAHYRFNKLTLISIGEIFRFRLFFFRVCRFQLIVLAIRLCLSLQVQLRFNNIAKISFLKKKENYGRLFVCKMSARASAH